MKRYLPTIALLVVACCCRADDWPRWRGPDNTGHVAVGVAVPRTLPAEPKVLWHVRIGFGHAAPVVSDGKVFYLDNQGGKETAHAAEAATGKEIWHATLDDAYQDQQGPAGPRCTPTVDGDRVYVQSCKGEFQCLRAADGKTVWRTNFVKDYGAAVPAEAGPAIGAARHGNTAPALVDGDGILVCVGGPDGASVVCFDKRTGRVIWKSQNDVAGYGSPVIATIGGVRQVVVFTAEGLIGLDPATGTLLWRAPIKSHYGRHATTPVVVGDMVVVSSITIGLTGFRITRAGDAWSAAKAWSSSRMAVNFACPVAVGPYVYGIGPASTLFCADARTGEPAWLKDRFFEGRSPSGWTALLAMRGNLLALTESGRLMLLAVDAKDCKTLGDASVCGANWCSPAYANGRLFLRDAQELRCVQLVP